MEINYERQHSHHPRLQRQSESTTGNLGLRNNILMRSALRQLTITNPYFSIGLHTSASILPSKHTPVTIVAHSFGCLAAVIAIKQHRPLVNAALLVAPASPIRFTKDGHTKKFPTSPTISSALPDEPLGITGLIVASQNDPWMDYEDACELSLKWGMPFHNVGYAGHINIESGHTHILK